MITEYIIPLLVNFAEYSILLMFLSHFLYPRERFTNNFLVGLIGVIFSFCLLYINKFESPLFNAIGGGVMIFLIVLMLYRAKLALSLAFALIYVNISITAELLFTFLFLLVNQNQFIDLYSSEWIYIGTGIFGKALLAIIVVILIRKFPHKFYSISPKDIVLLIVVPIFAISATLVILYLSHGVQFLLLQNLMLILLEIGLLSSGIMVFFIYDGAIYKQELENQLTISRKAIEMNELIFKEQHRSIEVDRAQNHDFKFHLNNIKSLYQNGSPEAITYHDNLIRQFEEAESLNMIDVNNHVISNILERVRRQCKLSEICIDLQIKYNQLGFIDLIDACALFDNAFDNAISACMQLETGRWIKATLVKAGDYVVITVLNSKSNLVINDNGKLLSTKRGYKSIGYGVESIKAVAEKYSGDASMKFSENDFELIIRLNEMKPTL